jgi:hypothetical protein
MWHQVEPGSQWWEAKALRHPRFPNDDHNGDDVADYINDDLDVDDDSYVHGLGYIVLNRYSVNNYKKLF